MEYVEFQGRLTILKAALVDRIFGLGFSILGAGGGRAATWGAAASGDSEVAEGTTVGGELASGGDCCPSGDRSTDIIARREKTDEGGQHGYRKDNSETRLGWLRRAIRTTDNDMVVVEEDCAQNLASGKYRSSLC